MSLRKAFGWIVVVFLIYFVVKNPTGAAHAGKSLIAGTTAVADGFGAFFAAVTG